VRITVNAPPVADLGGDLIAAPGDPVHLSAANSFDPDGRIAVARWDFSDHTKPMIGSEITRNFDKPGIYTARLTVTDNSGAANGSDSKEIRIDVNHQPAANPGPNAVTDSSVVSFDGTGSVDPDGDALTYRWDFGDGNSSDGAQVQHTYAVGGTYPIILVVDDGKGLSNSTNRAVKSVIIHKPPLADAGGNREVCTGDIITFDGSNREIPKAETCAMPGISATELRLILLIRPSHTAKPASFRSLSRSRMPPTCPTMPIPTGYR
jgi:hypothetical protein